MASVIYAFVGKGRTVWADHVTGSPMASSSVPLGGMTAAPPLENLRKTAVAMMTKLRGESGQFNFNLDSRRVAYVLLSDSVCFGCIAAADFTANAAMLFLGKLKEQFHRQYSTEQIMGPEENAGPFKKFSQHIKVEMEKVYDGGNNKITQVKSQIEDTKNVMVMNIDKVLQRGEKLEDVMIKSDSMRDHAMQFRNKGRKLRRALWCQNMKLTLVIIAALLLLAFVIFLAACKGFSCTK
eukprot:jgi/Pico_ML_1/52817/g3468.t1